MASELRNGKRRKVDDLDEDFLLDDHSDTEIPEKVAESMPAPVENKAQNDVSEEKENSTSSVPEKVASAEKVVSAEGQSNEQLLLMLANFLATKTQLLPAGNTHSKSPVSSLSAEQKKWAEWDRAYQTPTFNIRNFHEDEKLYGHKNYKVWRKMVDLDLAALNLHPFIQEQAATSIQLSPARRHMLDAQTLQYLKASVKKNVAGHLQNVYTAYSAMEVIERMFKQGRSTDMVLLHQRFARLRFKKNFDKMRFCSDFDAIIDEYRAMGTTFVDSYLATVFLEKIDGIHDSHSTFFSFYSTITSLPEDMQTLEYIKNRFLSLNSNTMGHNTQATNERKRKMEDKENASVTDSRKKLEGNSFYTGEQLATIRKWSKEEKAKNRCGKCGQYFHEATKCKNPGRMCFSCFNFGHEASACTKKKGNFEKYDKVIQFLIDSAANEHAVNDKSILFEYRTLEKPTKIETAGKNSTLMAVGIGTLPIVVAFNKIQSLIVLKNVYYAPQLSDNTISVRKFNREFRTYLIFNSNNGFLVNRKLQRKLAMLFVSEGVYRINASTASNTKVNSSELEKVSENSEGSDVCIKTTHIVKNSHTKSRKLTENQKQVLISEGEIWHKRMGHISAPYLNRLKKVSTGVNDLLCNASIEKCEICAKAKLTRKSFNKDRESASRPCEIVHCDLIGPISPPTFVQQNKYILCVIDDYTRFAQVFVIKTKDETSKCMKLALQKLQAQFPGPGAFKKLRCDGGSEFVNEKMSELLQSLGIEYEIAEPNTHEHNATVERFNRTIQERGRSLLFESGFSPSMWGLAVQAAEWLYNRTPHAAIDYITPYEQFYGKSPDLKQIKIFGSKVEVLDENIPRSQKFMSRSKVAYLVGFRNTGYILYDPITKKTFNSCNVRIDESQAYGSEILSPETESTFEIDTETVDDETNQSNINPIQVENSPLKAPTIDENDSFTIVESTIQLEDDWSDSESDTQRIMIHSTKTYPSNFGDYEDFHKIHYSKEIPMTYADALSEENKSLWETPIKSELQSLADNNVWEIVPRKSDMQIVPVKWLFTVKSDGKRKARLVAVGCQDKEKYESQEKVAPTPSLASIRWAFALASKHNWDLVQLDVKTAFLYSKIDREKYIRIPDGVNTDSKKFVCKLKKALYGLATAPKCWNQTFDEFIQSCGYNQSTRDPCVYSIANGDRISILIVHVDDILITGNDPKMMKETCENLKLKFEIKDLGFPKKFLGFEIEKCKNKKLFIHQSAYIDEILTEFRMVESLSKPTPMMPIANHKLVKSDSKDCTFPYKQAIGALLYVSNYTRPDIAFAVNYLARFQADPKPFHWTLIKRIFRYLKGTKSMGIMYECQKSENFDVFVDADHAGDPSRKSTTGYVVRMFGCPIMWCSRKQVTIAESTGEAEYVAICEAARDILFLTRLTTEVVFPVQYPIVVYEDNIAALRKCNSSCAKGRLKHLELKYFKVREYVKENILKIVKIDTGSQVADILTKPMLEQGFVKFRTCLKICENC